MKYSEVRNVVRDSEIMDWQESIDGMGELLVVLVELTETLKEIARKTPDPRKPGAASRPAYQDRSR
jgi:hypothetical protein